MVTDQLNRVAEITLEESMAREHSGMEKMMEMLLLMQMQEERMAQREREDRRREDDRIAREEEWVVRRERQDREREEERERRQEKLIQTLKESQPAIPQQVSITKLDLPRKKDGDDPV